jgi:putative ABC transport system substrate-binding protein
MNWRPSRGASPTTLPIEQPVEVQFRREPQDAKALGLTIPPTVLARADEVIQ